MLTIIEKVIFLQNVDTFTEVPTEQLAYLAAIAEEVTVAQNDIVYRRHDPADALYVVLSGTIRLHQDDREITLAREKDAFGTWALFDEEPRVVTATAVEDSTLLRIYREDFVDLLADNVQVTQGVLKTLTRRLRSLIERVSSTAGGRPPA
jgi:CRP-like cAMP-binding protein